MIGVLARREIEFLDIKTAKLLEKVADEARKMEAAPPQASPIFERKAPAHPVTSTATLGPADVLDAATPLPAPVPVAAVSPARGARPVALAAPPKTASLLAGDLALVGPLSGAGDARLGGPIEGEIGARDVTVRPGGRVEGVVTGRRIEGLGRVRGGLVADEVLARINAQVDGGVTSDTENPLKFAYLQCRMYCRSGLVLLLRMEGYDDIQARSIIDNHPSRGFRMTDDDLAFEQRKAQRLAEKKAYKPLKRA